MLKLLFYWFSKNVGLQKIIADLYNEIELLKLQQDYLLNNSNKTVRRKWNRIEPGIDFKYSNENSEIKLSEPLFLKKKILTK